LKYDIWYTCSFSAAASHAHSLASHTHTHFPSTALPVQLYHSDREPKSRRAPRRPRPNACKLPVRLPGRNMRVLSMAKTSLPCLARRTCLQPDGLHDGHTPWVAQPSPATGLFAGGWRGAQWSREAHLLKVLPLMVFFSALSFSGTARFRTCSQLLDRLRMRVCSCDLVALMWYTRYAR